MNKSQAILSKAMKVGVPLGEYVEGKIFRGVLTGLNEAFVIDRKTRDSIIAEDPKSAEIIKPFLLGRDIKRYQSPASERYLILYQAGHRHQAVSAIQGTFIAFKDPADAEAKKSGR